MGNQTEWSERKIEQFQSAIIDWFNHEGRHDLPWRTTRDPYAVLVSELMLQQTQVATVLNRGFFENWLSKFPNVETLASADEDEILKAWEGLGYYNRARNLQKAAKEIVENHGGRFPEELEGILALPGVGRYTAGAVYSCAFEKSAPVVDGNVVRVFSRIFGSIAPVDTTVGQKQMWAWAEELVPESNAREFNSGLMELGQRICRKSNPACDDCVVRVHCIASRQKMNLDELPVKKNRQKIVAKTERVVFLKDGNRVFLTQESGKRRTGLWRLPEFDHESVGKMPEIFRMKYGITKYRVDLLIFRGSDLEAAKLVEGDGQWFSVPDESDACAMAAPYRKALTRLLENEFTENNWELKG
ncbi:UNVERIFIED_CONTAM: hypothetical protein GTU68_046115 [Idotea baltica]|nr:hypothetical protein [Idotea baltica]